MTKSYLVTGGAGFLGSGLVQMLLAAGHRVRTLDNYSRGHAHRLDKIKTPLLEILTGDIRDAAGVRQACEGMNGVFHLAYINGTEFFYSKPDLVLDVGVSGIMNVLQGCIENKVPELFLASSSEVYHQPSKIPTDETVSLTIPDPLNPRYSYSGGKIISELLAIHYGKKYFKRVVIFRPHNVYGPDMGTEHVIPQLVMRLKALLKAETGPLSLPIQGSGQESRAFVFIDDFINGISILLNKGEHLNIYHVGSTEEITIEKMALQIGQILNRNISVVPGSLPPGTPLRRCPDIRKMKALGYQPVVSFQQGLKQTVQWYLQNNSK